MRPEIVWYVVCYNERKILPFMVDYWRRIASKVIVFDDNSTDGTREYLAQFDWIEVRPYPIETGGELNDAIITKVKNECWKEQRGKVVDWVIVGDVDEIIWAEDLDTLLYDAMVDSVVVPRPKGLDFVSVDFPEYDGRLLHRIVGRCVENPMYDKCIIFDPDGVEEIWFGAGCHKARPVLRYGKAGYVEGLELLHFKYMGFEYQWERRLERRKRIAEVNLKNGWGMDNMWSEEEVREQWKEKWEKSVEY